MKYPETNLDYEADLEIDKNRLDEELLRQPQKMMQYNTAHAQAQFDRDRAKQYLDITKANRIQEIRSDAIQNGEKMGAGGVTDAVVDARLRSSPIYIDAKEKYTKAEYVVNVTFAGVMAMNARRPILESLVKLYLSGYWSEPRVEGATNMKAGASQSAMEESILRSAEVLPKQPPAPMRPPINAPTPKK